MHVDYTETYEYLEDLFNKIRTANKKFIKEGKALLKDYKEDLRKSSDIPRLYNTISERIENLEDKIYKAEFIDENLTAFVNRESLEDIVSLYNNGNYTSDLEIALYRARKYRETSEFKKAERIYYIKQVLVPFLIMAGPLLFSPFLYHSFYWNISLSGYFVHLFTTTFFFAYIAPVVMPIQILLSGWYINSSTKEFYRFHFGSQFGLPEKYDGTIYSKKGIATAAASHLYLSHALKNSGGWIEKK